MAQTSNYTEHETLLSLKDVSLTLGTTPILRDISLDVRDIERPDHAQGQVICFLGPSGIGKTQLSRIIAGLNKPTSGTVLMSVGGMMQPVRKGDVGVVFQSYPLFEFLTVKENLAIALKQHPNQSQQLVDDYILAFEIRPHLDKYPIQLSGGTRQRVAILQQLLCSEHFIILDEPFSGLDPIMKRRACDLITQLAQRDSLNTLIVITHDVTEGMAVADKVWLMGRALSSEGRCAAGEPATIVEIIDFAEMGICWDPGIYTNPRFMAEVSRVKEGFAGLLGQ